MSGFSSKWFQRIETTQQIEAYFIRWIVSIRWQNLLLIVLAAIQSMGCGSSKIKPVDIYPEDMCSHCRMAISDQSFASEIITASGEVHKFDDLGCLESFKAKSGQLEIAAIFMKDYETKNWILYERGAIVQTGIKTPMGSGKIAFADSARAREILEKFPLNGN